MLYSMDRAFLQGNENYKPIKRGGKVIGFIDYTKDGGGKKYYYNGWWFSNLNGWFFKKEWKSFLIENGAKMSKKSCENDKMEFKDFKMESYGKGLLLKPSSGYCKWGEKYYFGGWWFPKQNGWFFKKEFVSFLQENGTK